MDVYLPAMPSIISEFNTSPYMMKLIFIVNFIEFSLSALIFGAVADIMGRKPAILIALLLALLGQFLCVFSHTGWSLFSARFIQYAGAGALSSMLITLICDTTEGARRIKAIAMFELALPIAIILGPSVGVGLLNFIGWRGTFMSFTMVQLVCFLGACFTLNETLKSNKTVRIKDSIYGMSGLLKNPIVSIIIAILGITEGGFMIYTILASFFYTQVFGLNIVSYGKYQTAVVVFFLLGLFTYRFMINLATPSKIFNFSMFFYALFGILLLCFFRQIIIPTPVIFCCSMLVMNFICGLISPSGNTIALQYINNRLIGSCAATITSTINLIVGATMLWGVYIINEESLVSFFKYMLVLVVFCVFLWGAFMMQNILKKEVIIAT